MKKFNLIMFILFSMFIFTLSVQAADVQNEQEFVAAIENGENIKVVSDFEVTENILLSKKIVLDLNNHTITFTNQKYLKIVGGNLEITGTGTMVEKTPYYSPVILKGSVNKEDTNYSTLTVGENVTLKGWAGVFIDSVNGENKVKDSYGVTVNVYGTLVGLDDTSGEVGTGIYENGSISHVENAPVINIYKSAKINATGAGIYAAGYGVWNIEGATIEGNTGIEIRAGILTINGATIIGNGVPVTVTPNGNGSTTVGAGIAIAQHTTKNIVEVKIIDGTIKGYSAVYESNPQKNSEEDLKKVNISITGGTFETINGGKTVVYSEDKTNFITGGRFNTNFDVNYLGENYIVNNLENYYVVEENKIIETNNKEVVFESEESFSNKLNLVVTESTNDVSSQVLEKFGNDAKIKDLKLINLYEIQMFDGDVVVPMENGKFTISIAIDESLRNYDNYKVIYINEDGVIAETINAKLVDGKVVFTTTHLSTYGIIGYNNVIGNPETSDNIIIYATVLIATVFAIGGVVILKKRYN